MAKSSIISSILLLSLLTLTLIPKTHASFAEPISKQDLGIKALDDKKTQLTFYFHETRSGSNPSGIQIAKAKSTDQSSTRFGSLTMIDNALTEGPEPTSKLVGRAQGMHGSVDLNESALMMVMNLYFLEGEYNGSTLSVLGRDSLSASTGELPVVGGTGTFRFAKGYAQIKSQTFDSKTGDGVVQFNVFVNHADGSSSSTGSGSPSDGKSLGSTPSDGAPSSSQASLSKLVSFTSLFMIPLLYFFIF
ncbi:dirigent protein 23-like [Amaranthus tricolor]|uniref:dirigent protein 23-like n=1 Tax=Amaranthus tricolor TaxID=29722 RepID=UPI00258CE35F|nr:dirigent protein 23-like [Amaranthus tricolor]